MTTNTIPRKARAGETDTGREGFRFMWEKEIQRGALAKHGPATVAVALLLGSFGNHYGEKIFPEVAVIAEALGVSERYIRKHLDILRVEGFITEVGRTRHGVRKYKLTSHLSDDLNEDLSDNLNQSSPPLEHRPEPEFTHTKDQGSTRGPRDQGPSTTNYMAAATAAHARGQEPRARGSKTSPARGPVVPQTDSSGNPEGSPAASGIPEPAEKICSYNQRYRISILSRKLGQPEPDYATLSRWDATMRINRLEDMEKAHDAEEKAKAEARRSAQASEYDSWYQRSKEWV